MLVRIKNIHLWRSGRYAGSVPAFLQPVAAIIAVGYRINSDRATQFRIWTTDAFLRFNDAEVLQDKGKVTAAIAKEFAESEFEKYRVIQDALYESDFDKLMKSMEKKAFP